jgi:diguanylate cyclase (GGDEF)-like protein
VGGALLLFLFGPRLLGLDEVGRSLWVNAGWVLSSLLAAIACARTAAIAPDDDRRAWRDLALGNAAWSIGTIYWAYVEISRGVPQFPSAGDVCYVASSFFGLSGMFRFIAVRGLGRVQLGNFALFLSAATIALLLLIAPQISNSAPLPAVLALSYPVLGVGSFAFGVLGLVLYIPKSKRRSFTLLLASIALLATANVFYAFALLTDGYGIGAFFDGFWVGGFAFAALAAFEQAFSWRERGAERIADERPAAWHETAEVVIPAFALGLIVLAIVGAAVSNGETLALALAPGWAVLATIIGLREFWLLQDRRALARAAEESSGKLEESRAQLVRVLESTTDSVMVLDRDWRVIYLNSSAKRSSTTGREIGIGERLWDIFPDIVGTPFEAGNRRAMESQQPVEFEEYYPASDTWFQVRAYPTPETLSLFYRNVTDRHRAESRLRQLAHHDSLTGLVNRLRFGELLDEELTVVRAEMPVAVLYVDLDQFKEINDTLGHSFGDEVLTEMSTRLVRTASGGIVARVGGDEFAILLKGPYTDATLAELAGHVLSDLCLPCQIDGRVVHVGASIGIVLAPRDGNERDQLLKKADIALYAAKGDGRGTFRFFEPAMAERVTARQLLRDDLTAAIARSEFQLAFQPVIDLRTDRICAFETLLRWRHPTRGEISPAAFISEAEESGLIVQIGEWVLRKACAEAVKWPSDIRVAVNLSPAQFRRRSLAVRVLAALSSSGLSPSRLELEITESVLLQDSEANLAILHELRQLGIGISLDDFGIGYSSLSYLSSFPFDKIKIDRTFISQANKRDEPKLIVQAVVGLGRSLGMVVTAEGIETSDQLELVRETGCDEAQGHFFSRPLPADRVAGIIVENRAETGARDLRRQALHSA